MPERGLEARKSPSQERSHDMVEWIVEGAIRVLNASGYEALTTNRVAEEAGVSVGSVYQYFPNKDAIVAEVTRRHVEQALESFRSAFEQWRQHPPERIEDAVRALVFMSVAVNEPAVLHDALFDRSALNAGAEDAKDLFITEAVGGVSALLEHFGLQDDAGALAAELLVWSTWSVVHEVLLLQPAGDARTEAIEQWVRFLSAGLASSPPP